MSQTYPLDPVIRRLPTKPDIINSPMEKVITIDEKSGRILYKIPRLPWKRVGLDLRYYLVSSQSTVRCEGPVCSLSGDLRTGQSIDVNMVYEVSCKPGREEDVVLRLRGGNHPGAVLNARLETWFHDFESSKKAANVNVIQEFFNLRAELQQKLSQQAEALGLNLNVEVFLEGEKQLQPHPINSGNFPVRVKDYDKEVNLEFQTELAVDEENKVEAILKYHRLPQLDAQLKDGIKSFLIKKCTLHQYCCEFYPDLSDSRPTDMPSIRDELLPHLNAVLRNEGRKLTFLSLTGRLDSDSPPPASFKEIQHEVLCKITDWSEPITVKNQLQMNLKDVGKYMAAKISNSHFENWVRDKLSAITKTTLFEKTYVDLLFAFDSDEAQDMTDNTIKEQIRAAMQEEAEYVGYTIKHLVVIPNLKDLEPKNGFDIRIDGTFETLDASLKVKLNIIVTGRIRNLKAIEKYLSPQISILERMEQEVHNETGKLLHQIPPEQFYMQFTSMDGNSVEAELRTVIIDKLENMFCVEDINVIPKPAEDDELRKRFQALRSKGPYFLKVEAIPFRSEGHEESVPFIVRYDVLRVHWNFWSAFRSRDFQSHDEEIEKIEKVLEDEIKTRLDTVDIGHLRYASIIQADGIKEIIEPVEAKIAIDFGLLIKIANLRREATRIEVTRAQTVQAITEYQGKTNREIVQVTDQTLLEELNDLRSQRRQVTERIHELMLSDPEDEEIELSNERIENIDERMQEIRNRISSYSEDDQTRESVQLASGASDEFRLEDYQNRKDDIAALESMKMMDSVPKQIESKSDVDEEENE